MTFDGMALHSSAQCLGDASNLALHSEFKGQVAEKVRHAGRPLQRCP
jgi:hypothetical protein